MKKLGKKIHNNMETIEAYACGCSNCSSCSCNYAVCGNNTSSMANIYTSNSNNADNTLYNYGYLTGKSV